MYAIDIIRSITDTTIIRTGSGSEAPFIEVIDMPTVTDMNEVILKADRRGRLRYTPEQKQALIEACHESGASHRSVL